MKDEIKERIKEVFVKAAKDYNEGAIFEHIEVLGGMKEICDIIGIPVDYEYTVGTDEIEKVYVDTECIKI